jgi:hypothetical protein
MLSSQLLQALIIAVERDNARCGMHERANCLRCISPHLLGQVHFLEKSSVSSVLDEVSEQWLANELDEVLLSLLVGTIEPLER